MAETIDIGVAAGVASCLLTAILDVGHLIQVRVDVLGHLVEVAPFLTAAPALAAVDQVKKKSAGAAVQRPRTAIAKKNRRRRQQPQRGPGPPASCCDRVVAKLTP
jgi:hypothetical protein